ncbi:MULTISPECIES: DUF3995 domain-containing protein [Microbacterium]|uniref:DUF3995 domain-containing protein n=1 Tax=Microbacterium TaxID=33882 RepID=UPI001E2FD832|nr:DUF3995 domain-containing protein [Microbacterium nymphoidis]MCD2498314.1 DUF3995 domain-containing protein [Microbacterium nymphoidis]
MGFVRGAARVISGIGLAGVGVLHLCWSAGLNWPAKNRARLASATVGNARAMPAPGPTAVVGAVALVGGVVTAGALGESRLIVSGRRLIGLGLLTRAVLGGEVALRVLGMGPADPRFRRLDARAYRPLCAVLGAAVLLGSRRTSSRHDRSATA